MRSLANSALFLKLLLRLPVFCILLVGGVYGVAGEPPARPARHRPYQVGYASWYGKNKDQGKSTASGDAFDKRDFTAAHRRLPLGSVVRVTNLKTGKSVEVTINDRGPHRAKVIIDLSKAAARQVGQLKDGLFRVRLDVVNQPVPAKEGGTKSAESPKPGPSQNTKEQP